MIYSRIIKRKSGFTLIELLIVVAIIAILAAIAVPNFLEAQVRSKVSRTMADMRSIATALESYAIDNSGYVSGYHSNCVWKLEIDRLTPLTTPISFITSIPADVFYIANPGDVPGQFGYWDYSDKKNVDRCNVDGTWEVWGNGTNSQWRMASNGPDKLPNWRGAWGVAPSLAPNFLYDPTNGTVSPGDVIRFGP